MLCSSDHTIVIKLILSDHETVTATKNKELRFKRICKSGIEAYKELENVVLISQIYVR